MKMPPVPIRLLLLAVLLTAPALAQFQSIEITFDGIGCKPCIDSLPERLRRIRGVESATVDPDRGLLSVRLADQNRVRLEQIRDFIEQDGTKARRATVRVAGELKPADARLVLQPPNLPAAYIIEAGNAAARGPAIVTGTASDLRPESGTITIRATDIRKPD
jgi:copper chaperone CopZ